MSKKIWYKIGDIKAIGLDHYLRQDDDLTGDRQIRFANLYGVLQNLPDNKLDRLKHKCYDAFQAAQPGEKKDQYEQGFSAIQNILRDRDNGRKNRAGWAAYERGLNKV
jgi:hypothetical protein